MQSRTFILFAVALSVLAVTHSLATAFFLYWTYPWFDIPMHALGGVVVALGSLVFFDAYGRGALQISLFVTLGVVLIAGALWEVFELVSRITLPGMDDVPDTALDLAMDLVGGVVGYMSARSMIRGRTASL